MDFDIHIKPLEKDSFVLIGRINDPDLIHKLKSDITMGTKRTSNSNYKTNVMGKMTNFKYLNTNTNLIKFLDLIRPMFKKVFTRKIELKDSWGNILGKNDYVYMHNHHPSSVSGILYLTENVSFPKTYFPLYNMHIEPEVGKFVLFDPLLEHEVPKNKSSQKRYTLIFNFQLKGDYDHLEQR
mgnify:CR=1 FL=1|tara:strand:+ start:237 stop:782 length:546 start_codon:yes stop_codon:yes gene_type:complete